MSGKIIVDTPPNEAYNLNRKHAQALQKLHRGDEKRLSDIAPAGLVRSTRTGFLKGCLVMGWGLCVSDHNQTPLFAFSASCNGPPK